MVDSGGSTIGAKSDGKSKNRNRRRGIQNQPDHGSKDFFFFLIYPFSLFLSAQLPGPPMPSYLPIAQPNGGIAHPNPGIF